MKLSAVIVNYNDKENTVNLVSKLINYKNIDFVVVVDNCSTDNSCNELRTINNPKFYLLSCESNKGYGEGNNIGIKFSSEQLSCTHSLIINPDVDIDEIAIVKCKNIFKLHANKEEIFIVAPSSFSKNIRVVWKVRGFEDLVLSQERIISSLFKIPFYDESYFSNSDSREVDAVLGACLMVDNSKFKFIGGYDSSIFLYEEENYLALMCKKYKFKTIVLCNTIYIHNHKSDSQKTLKQQLVSRNLMNQSLLYILRKYCSYNSFKLIFSYIFLAFCNIELILSFLLKRITGKF